MEEELLNLLNDISYYLNFKTSKYSGQKRILSLLKQNGEMTQRDLTYQLGIQSSSMSEILEKMELKGLIHRQHSKRDRRTLDIFMTEKGFNEANKADRENLTSQQYLFSGFTDTEMDILRQLLTRLLFNLEGYLFLEDQNNSHHKSHHRNHRHFHKHGPKHGKHPKHRKF